MTQAVQVFMHRKFISPALARQTPVRRLPLPFKLLQQFPWLRRISARIVGLGFRPEHIHIPDAKSMAGK
jgi:hypothetical protein